MRDRRIERVTAAGLHIALAMAIGGCQIELPGTPCGGGRCKAGMRCETDSNSGAPICVVPGVCNNHVVEPEFGEVCDPPEEGICSSDCKSKLTCNNHIIDPDEECDNGDDNGDDKDCRHDCFINFCGDGYANTHGKLHHEDCDGAPQASGTGIAIPIETADCNLDCTTPSCGDGKINRHFKPDGVHPEQCDSGTVNGVNLNQNNAACTATCQVNVCGDHNVLEGIEECDDGGVDTATCNHDCTLPVCGDGLVNTEADEQCDNGTVNGVNQNQDTAACTSRCKINVCGDHHVLEGIEQCDPGRDDFGNVRDTATCDHDCTLQVCGDGLVNSVAGEECDDGADNGTPASAHQCDSRCKSKMCGNGVVDVGEDCDDGANGVQHASARCNSDCTFARCGDSQVNDQFKPDGVNPEICDNLDPTTHASLNGVPCDYGDPNCTRCNATCTGTTQPGGPFCGDGLVQPNEGCDPTTGPAMTLPSLLARADSATCNINCTPLACGDGHVNVVAGESCDDGNQRACGTCQATDCRGATPITPTKATSTITTANGDKIGDLDTLKLDDGFGKTITLEFDLGGLHDATHIPISFVADPATDAATIASRMVDAINTKAPTGFLITASAPMDGATVTLTNTRKSAFGNTTIGVNGRIGITGGFAFSASPPRMTGGAAGDCLMGTGCVSGDDCKSGTCDSTHTCR